MSDLVPEWFDKKRLFMQDTMAMGKFFDDDRQISTSQNGKYKVEWTPYAFSEKDWFYCHVALYRKENEICTFQRNYANFPHRWVNTHPKNREYLVCAEDTMSLSVIDLRTGILHTWIDESQEDRLWVKHLDTSEDGSSLAVFGSIWGGLDIIRFYDFSNPISYPWKLLGQFDGYFVTETDTIVYPTTIVGWDNNALIVASENTYDKETHENVTNINDGLYHDKLNQLEMLGKESDMVYTTVHVFTVYPDGTYQKIDEEILD